MEVSGDCSVAYSIRVGYFHFYTCLLYTSVFDKTGTLTKGTFEVQFCNCESGVSEEELIRMIASVESSSTHPIAKAVVNYAGQRDIELSSVTDSKAVSYTHLWESFTASPY